MLIDSLRVQIRSLSHNLHPPALHHLGLIQALQQYCEEFGRSHELDIQFTSDIGSDRFTSDSGLCLYRIVQESLRNVAKHARTHRVEVSLVRDGVDCALTVRDFGCGFEVANLHERGLGLLSMLERVEVLHGKLEVTSEIGLGTVITARIPISREPIFRDKAIPVKQFVSKLLS